MVCSKLVCNEFKRSSLKTRIVCDSFEFEPVKSDIVFNALTPVILYCWISGVLLRFLDEVLSDVAMSLEAAVHLKVRFVW